MKYTDNNRTNDFHWFLKHYDDLFKEYGHKFLVIQNEKILGTYDDKNIALDTTLKRFPIGTFIVQECNGEESGYTNYITSWELI